MVLITPLIGAAALLSSFASALPRPDSSVGEEVGVSAPNGIPLTDTAELASQTAAEAAAMATGSSMSSSSYGSSGSSYGSNSGSSYGSNSGSSYGSSGSSYGSSDSSYGSSGSSYGSSGSSYGSSDSSASMSSSSCTSGDCSSSSNSGMSSSSSDCMSGDCGAAVSMADSSSIVSSVMVETTALATSTLSTALSYSTPSYGSGNSNWGGSEYDSCVQQCIASFGSPASYAPTATSGSMGSSGSGSTITVIVAPTQGVLRYIPFAVNASVGDTIKFMWGANNHTVTKSSELTPCNKTSENPVFATGEQNKDFVFTQVVNDTNTTFFYCGTPTHCEKGMFGIINPPSAFEAPSSVAGMMQSIMANDTSGNIATYASYTSNQTAGSMGANWGANIDMSSMPAWSYSLVAENVLFTRNVLAMNPDVMNADGSVNLNSLGSTPMMIPPDVGSALNAASGTSTTSSTGNVASAPATASSAASSATKSNGAISMTSSKVLVGAMALVATFFAL